MVDGVPMQTTTYHATQQDQQRKDHNLRRAELQEFRRLQKAEARQIAELNAKAHATREQQDRKAEQEMQALIRQYDTDLDTLLRHQKKQMEDSERLQEDDVRVTSKKIKLEQEKEVKLFREGLKQEFKLLKQEVDMLTRSDRKDALKRRKEHMDADHAHRERQFVVDQQRAFDNMMQRVDDQHRERIALLEQQFLQQKHQLLRAREAAIWELEEKQLHEKNQLAKTLIKDLFFLQRSQMLIRHQKEMEHLRSANTLGEEELVKAQAQERKRLPRLLREEIKTRTMMYKESLRISMVDSGGDTAKLLKQFDESEKRRYKAEVARQEQKHAKKLQSIRQMNDASVRELEHLQNEKRKGLLEVESQKLKTYDEEYQAEIKAWKSQLKPRKQSLEEKFARELREQADFYKQTGSGPPSLPQQRAVGDPQTLSRRKSTSLISL